MLSRAEQAVQATGNSRQNEVIGINDVTNGETKLLMQSRKIQRLPILHFRYSSGANIALWRDAEVYNLADMLHNLTLTSILSPLLENVEK